MAGYFDTVAAISTPPGKGGVALIRMSGSEANKIAERVFITASGKPYSEIKPRVQTYGFITDLAEPKASEGNSQAEKTPEGTASPEERERIDDVLLTRFPAPNSYTGEDVVEICCHGGILVTRCVLEALIRAGARAAEAGEFTRRAFISGKLSLTEAEAIGTLLDAGSREQIRISAEPARRRLEERIAKIRGELVGIMSSVYARIDYPDEDLGDYSDGELLSALLSVADDLKSLAATYRTGRAITEGIRAVIVGKPNVGKSSLYNLLVGEDAAIVTSVAGTTRDVLERSVPLGRVMLRLCDTAGIRGGKGIDAVEEIGIRKSRELMAKCELLFAVFDNSEDFDGADAELISEISRLECAKIALINKSDLKAKFDRSNLADIFERVIEVSALDEAETVRSLVAAAEDMFTDGSIKAGLDPILSSARQHGAICAAADALSEAIAALRAGFMQDAVSGLVEAAIGYIGELDGREVGEEIVSDIFSKFCVGK
ncbi:MAG: tRNA uridine-5-carboxymethylaminomethyl(34) synthesis GTPase MnmE [Clostridia bacterium]|nr:tRNA uridine-5-carboxymethylaminomethyl(34) synthesis GTPase MnmE [Clostridia bacterium]